MDANKPQKPLKAEARWFHGMTVFRKYTDGTLHLDENGLRLVDSANKELFALAPKQVKYVSLVSNRMSIKSKTGQRYALMLGPNYSTTGFLHNSVTRWLIIREAERIINPPAWIAALKAQGYPIYSYKWIVITVVLAAASAVGIALFN